MYEKYKFKGNLGSIIKEGRKQIEKTQAELAEIMGVTQSLVSKWEKNERVPDGLELLFLIRFLGITDEILQWDKVRKNEPKHDHRQLEKRMGELEKEVAQLREKLEVGVEK